MNQILKSPSYEIYGSLIYIGLDAEGNIHLIINKESSFSLSKVIRDIKRIFEGSEVRMKFEYFKRT